MSKNCGTITKKYNIHVMGTPVEETKKHKKYLK